MHLQFIQVNLKLSVYNHTVFIVILPLLEKSCTWTISNFIHKRRQRLQKGLWIPGNLGKFTLFQHSSKILFEDIVLYLLPYTFNNLQPFGISLLFLFFYILDFLYSLNLQPRRDMSLPHILNNFKFLNVQRRILDLLISENRPHSIHSKGKHPTRYNSDKYTQHLFQCSIRTNIPIPNSTLN